MSLSEDVKKNEELIIHSPVTGFMRAWALEDKECFGLASFSVGVNSTALPGVSQMTINLNRWDVWKADDIEALKKVSQEVLKADLVR